MVCWFRAMFEVDMRERGDGSVNLDNLSPDAVRSFLDFAYSGEMLITDANVDMLFQIASFLQVQVRPSLEIMNSLLKNCLSQPLLVFFSPYTRLSANP